MSTKGTKTGITFNCEWCGKEVYQNRYHYNKNRHHYCSNECQKKAQRQLAYEIRKCEVCGKEFECSKKSTQRFCSDACQHEWQKGNTGTKNSHFKSVLTHCTWCGKKFYIKPSKLANQMNTFCSKKCRQEWYAKYWSQRDEWRDKNRKKILKAFQEGKMSNINTVPQVIANDILDRLDIPYLNEKPFVYYTVDNYLYEHNLIIEVMGDYWHVNPLIFSNKKLTEVQRKRIPKDKAKHKYLAKYYGIECLYLWEHDLEKNAYLCELLTEQYYFNDGKLPDYNSFNYHLEDGQLALNDEIIYPLFLIDSNETKEAG